jgi:hypothetical protein
MTPCVTKTSEKKEYFRQPTISSRRILVGQGTSGNSSGSTSSTSSSQLSTPHRGGIANFTMEGEDPIIRLPKFHGEGSEDPKKHLFICENIWEAKQIIDEDTKVAHLTITFRNHTLDWFMSLAVNSPQGAPTTIVDVKKELINEF